MLTTLLSNYSVEEGLGFIPRQSQALRNKYGFNVKDNDDGRCERIFIKFKRGKKVV